MIKINLARKKQYNLGGGDSPGLGKFDLKAYVANLPFDQLRELPLKRMVLLGGGALLSYYALSSYEDDELQKADAVLQKLNSEQSVLTAEVAKTKGYEQIKTSLENDEHLIRTKIETIQKLSTSRQVAPKTLIALSNAIPTSVWLTEFEVASPEIKIKGVSADFDQISDFMKNLGESAYFGDLKPVDTKKIRDAQGVEVAEFELSAKAR